MGDINKDLLGLIEGRRRQDGGRNKLSELFSSDEEGEVNEYAPSIATTNKTKKLPEQDEQDEFNDGFDKDLMGDEEDRKRLAAMTEIEREAVLYERAQVRLAKIERKELERKVQALEESEKQAKLKKTASAKSKIAKLSELSRVRRGKRGRASDSDSDYVEDNEEEYRPTKGLLKDPRNGPSGYNQWEKEKKSDPLTVAYNLKNCIGLEMANELQITRSRLIKWIYHPQFDDAAKGCLLRLAIYKGNEQVYRVTEIKKIVKYHRSYAIDNSLITNKAALLKYGKSEKTFQLDVISNSPFTQEEFNRWMTTLKEEKQPLITTKMAESRISSWKALEESHLTDDIVSAMVAEKRKVGAVRRNPVTERTMLIHLREEAIASGNAEEVERIDEEIEKLSRVQEVATTAHGKDRADVAMKRSRFLNVSLAADKDTNGAEPRLDPFSRRKCQPTDFNSFFEESSTSRSEGSPASQLSQSPLIDTAKANDESPTKEPQETVKVTAEKVSKSPIDEFLTSAHVNIQIDI